MLKSETIDMLGLTDHRLIQGFINVENQVFCPRKITCRSYKYFNYGEFSRDAMMVDWRQIYHMSSITDKVDFFNSAVISLFDVHSPIITFTPKGNYRSSITDTLRDMIALKDNAYKKYRKSKCETDFAYYKDLRNYVTIAVRNEKAAYFKYEVGRNKNNSKQLWKFLEQSHIHKRQQNEIDDDIKDADNINYYFLNSTSFPNIDDNLTAFFRDNYCQSELTKKCLSFDLVTPSEVENIVNKMKSDAYGADGINLKMLKLILPFCLDCITNIINTSLEYGEFPSLWKKAIVTPLSKVSKAANLCDLRPISVLPPLSKIVERIVYCQLMAHLKSNSILPPIQSGFRRNYSTATALSKINNDIVKAIDNSEVTFLVLLDFSKAFDAIDHNLLLAKLSYYGCGDVVLKWLNNYLSGRLQQVKCSVSLSTALPVKYGVPQGSILGPILFAVFTSDLPSIVKHCKIHMYADDTQVYLSGSPLTVDENIVKLNQDLLAIQEWSVNSGLLLNTNKTVAMCLGSSRMCSVAKDNMSLNIKVNGTSISFSDCAKNLGLLMDSNLTYEPHVNKKLSVCYMKLKHLYKFKFILPPHLKWNIVNSLVLSQLDYCNTVYFPHTVGYLRRRLQLLQNACLRFSFVFTRYEHVTPYYVENSILKLEFRYQLSFATQLFNILKCNEPSYLRDMLIFRSNIHSIKLRHADLLNVPQHRSSKYESGFEYLASKIYNEYVITFTECNSTHTFKKKLNKILLDIQHP